MDSGFFVQKRFGALKNNQNYVFTINRCYMSLVNCLIAV